MLFKVATSSAALINPFLLLIKYWIRKLYSLMLLLSYITMPGTEVKKQYINGLQIAIFRTGCKRQLRNTLKPVLNVRKDRVHVKKKLCTLPGLIAGGKSLLWMWYICRLYKERSLSLLLVVICLDGPRLEH